MKTLERFSAEGLVNVETQRFRIDPVMSYVPKETRAADQERPISGPLAKRRHRNQLSRAENNR